MALPARVVPERTSGIRDLAEAIPSTALLAVAALLIALLFGLFLGILSALKVHTWVDNLIAVLAVLGYSLPSYVAAILLALVFGYWLENWTGLEVQGGLALDDFGDWDLRWRNLVLPAIALGLRPVALIAQLTRGAMLSILSRTIPSARAKGLPAAVVVVRHALRNALNPVASAVSGWFAALLTGAFLLKMSLISKV